ncbi:MAG: ABC transporter ATP-binding protein [Nitrososphaerota archaeon]|jgi:ABC-2 type transport system ATP-binding protein|nr:ABC transporter ATP-binding protein [Nitrososphaerota archaeon]
MTANILGEFEGVVKRFKEIGALNGLTFKIYKGVNGLIGPNGAGKTTTIRLSLGLIKPDTGSATLLGFDCWKQSLDLRQRIGILYEKPAFYDHLSGLDHLKLMAKLKKLSDPLGESKQVLKLVDFDNEAQYRRISGYSAGMRQRLGLAHALLGQPELIILDEPTSNLDPLGRAQVIELLNTLKKRGFSFLISSHILSELEKVCDHVILMNGGIAVRQGMLASLLSEVPSGIFRIKVHPNEPIVDLLKQEESVKSVTPVENYLIVITYNAHKFQQRLPFLVARANAFLEEVKMEGNDLESLFKIAVAQGDKR